MSDRRTAVGALFALLLSAAWVVAFPLRTQGPSTPLNPDAAEGPQRIVSGSTRADQVLWRLIEDGFEPSRVVAVTGVSQRSGPPFDRFRAVERLSDLEVILGFRPDLVFANGVGDGRAIARLEAEGVPVLNLGPLGGLESFLDDVVEIGAAVGAAPAGQQLARSFAQAMRSVAADVAAPTRPGGLVLIPYDGVLFGGAAGSSYHDVLIHGGLRDLATEAGFTGWPRLPPERVIALDPSWILTQTPNTVCEGLLGANLSACPDQVIALPPEVLGDPGLGMLEAARLVRRQVYGMPPPP
jgi:iron complex transport system substrate-binding protein